MQIVRNCDPKVTWDDVKRSRHVRRAGLETARNLLDGGWERLEGVPFDFQQAFVKAHPECFQRAQTRYNDRRKPSRNEKQDWYLSPKHPLTAQEIIQTAVDEYYNDPEQKYRAPYQMRLILEMEPDEIQTLYMMHRLGD